MKKTLLITTLLMAGFTVPAMAEQSERPPKPPSFETLDANGDGELSKDEVTKGPLAEKFDELDTDGSGTLSEDEMPEPPKGGRGRPD